MRMLGKRLYIGVAFGVVSLYAPWVWSATSSDSADKTGSAAVTVDWTKVIGESKTTLTIQVCPEPPMRRGGPIHEQTHAALRDLKMSYARLQPWFPYPKLAIPELDPPQDGKTSWDFSLIDPIVLDFYAAQEGRPIMLNMAIPAWLFKAPRHRYPDDPNEIDWAYEFRPDVGTEFRDPTFKEAAAHFKRIAQWYIKGGFTDEFGKKHVSGHRLNIDYWEVLNEQDEGMAHQLNPQVYTALYDAIVAEVRKVDPSMKFSGLAMADASSLHYFEYFLNAKNHKPGIPLDMVSYHKYIVTEPGSTLPDWQRDMFADADRFVHTMRKIERIRQRLSPRTKTFISELGAMWGPETENVGAAMKGGKSDFSDPRIPDEYWTLAASVFAYGYLGAIREGVDMVAAAELVDYPGQFAGTNLIHWETGEPNAVYRVVKLLKEEIPPGAQLLQTRTHGRSIEAQAFMTPQGRKLLLINKTAQQVQVTPGALSDGTVKSVDMTTRSAAPREYVLEADLVLQPQSVTLISSSSTLSENM